MRFFLIVGFLLQCTISANCQNIDSLAREVDSSAKAFEETNENFQRLQDSLYRIQIQRSLDQNSKNLDVFLADMKERERKEKRQMYIRLGLGGVFLAVLVYGLARRRKMRRNSAN